MAVIVQGNFFLTVTWSNELLIQIFLRNLILFPLDW